MGDGTGLDIMDFAWANDGYNLVAIVSDYVRYDYHYDIQRQMITVLDPNNDNGGYFFEWRTVLYFFFSKLVRDIDLILLASCSSQNLNCHLSSKTAIYLQKTAIYLQNCFFSKNFQITKYRNFRFIWSIATEHTAFL